MIADRHKRRRLAAFAGALLQHMGKLVSDEEPPSRACRRVFAVVKHDIAAGSEGSGFKRAAEACSGRPGADLHVAEIRPESPLHKLANWRT